MRVADTQVHFMTIRRKASGLGRACSRRLHRDHPLRRRSRQLQSAEADAALDTTIDRKMGRMRILSACLGVVSAAALSIGAPVRAPVTVPMSQYDYGRTGANLQESILDPSNVDAAHFGKLFSRRVDDSI